MCPVCPLSGGVRCGVARPILEPMTGMCYTVAELGLSESNIAAAPIASAGFSIDVSSGVSQSVALFSAAHAIAGKLELSGAASGPQPAGSSLICAEVKSCEAHWSPALRSRAVMIAVAPHSDSVNVVVALPVDDLGVGPMAADGYGHCLGRFDESSNSWHCVDEALVLRHSMMSGVAHGDGCYAIMRDNCPDVENPDQTDSDSNGEGDLCAGGATLCEDCHSWNMLNRKFLKKVCLALVLC